MGKHRQPTKHEIIQGFREAFVAEPVGRVYADLVIDYVTKVGGRHLAFWQKYEGVLWTSETIEPTNMTLADAAQAANIPISEAEKIWKETWDAIRPKLQTSEAWKKMDHSKDVPPA